MEWIPFTRRELNLMREHITRALEGEDHDCVRALDLIRNSIDMAVIDWETDTYTGRR